MIVAIAVDGVLTPFPRFTGSDEVRGGYVEHELRIAPALLPSRTRAWTTSDIHARRSVRLNPAHGDWLNTLIASPGVQPVWASRWERAASLLEPLLELDAALPVVEFSRHAHLPIWQRINVCERQAKIGVLDQLYPTQPIVWIDHVIPRSRIGRARHGRGGNAGRTGTWRYYHHVDAFLGLTRTDMACVDTFIASMSGMIATTAKPGPGSMR